MSLSFTAQLTVPSQAKSGGDMTSSGFPARAQSAAANNANAAAAANGGGATGGNSGKGGDAAKGKN